MRAIRIWHLAALALSVPLLAAALPPGCYGGLNPNFVDSIGGSASSAMAPPKGYHVLGIFDESGWFGNVDVTITGNGGAFQTGWSLGFGSLTARAVTWKCDLQQIEINGGDIWVPDQTGQFQQQQIQYTGPTLDLGNQLVCGMLVKLTVVPLQMVSGLWVQVPPYSTQQTVPNIEWHIFVELLADETDASEL